jgi:class 3 adenylate cyclase
LITWKLPEVEEGESEKNEQRLEQRTEFADKALITAVKIVSEIRRYNELTYISQKPEIIKRLEKNYRPNLTFGLHMGWAIEGAIGSAEYKIDACYLSPHKTIADRIEDLCHYYDMQILVTESLYNLMSLKARNTLRKIDVITMNECKEPRGIYTFDLSFKN